MNTIQRDLKKVIEAKIGKGKVIVLIGPRQVGKTTLLKDILTTYSENKSVQFWNCDEPDIRSALADANSAQLKTLAGKAEFIVIDEAQRIKNIGLTIKLLHDTFPQIQLAVTGSSSLDLSNTINEPLTGRKFEYNLFPFSTHELVQNTSLLDEQRMLYTRLVYGLYPDVVNNPGDEKEILMNIVNSYLYKDVFEFQDIRKPRPLLSRSEAKSLSTNLATCLELILPPFSVMWICLRKHTLYSISIHSAGMYATSLRRASKSTSMIMGSGMLLYQISRQQSCGTILVHCGRISW